MIRLLTLGLIALGCIFVPQLMLALAVLALIILFWEKT